MRVNDFSLFNNFKAKKVISETTIISRPHHIFCGFATLIECTHIDLCMWRDMRIRMLYSILVLDLNRFRRMPVTCEFKFFQK